MVSSSDKRLTNTTARRNLTPEQQRYLLGRKYTAEKGVRGAPDGNKNARKKQLPEKLGVVSRPFDTHKDSTAAKIGKAAGVSDWTVNHSEKYADAVDDLDARGVS